MKITRAFIIMLIAISAPASAENCNWINNPDEWYFSSDGYAIPLYAFERTPYSIPPQSQPYLKRLAGIIKSQGTHLIAVPIPAQGITLAETSSVHFTPGTKFYDMTSAENRKKLSDAYMGTLNNLAQVDIQSFNVAKALVDHQRLHPEEALYFKRDNHWQTAGARVAAQGLANFLDDHLQGTWKKEDTKPRVSLNEGGENEASREYALHAMLECPTLKLPPLRETHPTVTLSRPAGDQSRLLFEDPDDSGAVLVGTSYTSMSPNYGFAPYLSEAMQSEVTNASMISGGLFGALTEYYSSLDPQAPSPSLLIWEFPAAYIAIDGMEAGVAVNRIRQTIPWVNRGFTPIQTLRISNQAFHSVIRASGHSYFLEFVFQGRMTRSFEAELRYDDGSVETVQMMNPRGQNLQRYRLELPDNGKIFKSASLRFSEPGPWKVSVSLNKYKNAL